MNNRSFLVYGLAAVVLFFGSACRDDTEERAQMNAETPPAQEETVAAPSQDLIAEGKALFTGKGTCFTCYGRDGTSYPIGPDLTDDA